MFETLRYFGNIVIIPLRNFMKTELCMIFELMKALQLEPCIYILI